MARTGNWFVALAFVVATSTRMIAAQTTGPATLDWQPTHTDAIRIAGQTNRLVLVHFYSPNCQACQTIERDVYSQPSARDQIHAKFVPFKVNVDEQPLTATKYGINSTPMDLILDSSGKPISKLNCPTTAEAYLAALDSALATAKANSVASTPAPVSTWMPPTVAQATPPTNSTLTQPSPAANVGRYQSPPPTAPTMPLAYNNPATPTTQAAPAVPSTSQAVAPATQPQKPAIAAYSDDRYAEFYKRWNAPPAAATQQPVVSQPAMSPSNNSLVQAPTTNPQTPAASSPTWGTAGYFGQRGQNPAAPATSTPSQPIAAAPQQPIAPVRAGEPPPGFEGYCPVTMIDQNRWQEGDRRWGVNHRGHTYFFAGPAEQQKFLAAPDHYSPAISGFDVVAAIDHGQMVEGQRKFGVKDRDGRMYLFSNAANRDAFRMNSGRYSTEVRQAENPNRDTIRR